MALEKKALFDTFTSYIYDIRYYAIRETSENC